MITTPEEAVLLWAMHPGGGTMPDAHDVDPDTLLRLTLNHRVVGRLLT
ncbi:MAG: hypothetical protein H8F28_20795, partial [Fibrella sp.]|nr:hypothetical protein [Armatimonadota bacterium]